MNETKLSPDDPRLTAYALGELEGDERAAIEAALQTDAAARAAVDEIRATTRQIEAALASEPMPEFKAITAPLAQRAAIIPGHDPRKLDGGPLGKLIRFPQAYYLVGGLAAACFAVMVTLHESQLVRVEERQKADIAARNEAMEKAVRETEFKKSVATVAEAKPSSYDEVTFPVPSAPAGKIELQAKRQEMAEADRKEAIAGSLAPNAPADAEMAKLQSFKVTTKLDQGYKPEIATATRVTSDIAGVNNSVPRDFRHAPRPSR